jgi:beta-galactosidase
MPQQITSASGFSITKTTSGWTVKGRGSEIHWSRKNGSMDRWIVKGKTIWDQAPKFTVFRAPVDNDRWAVESWYAHGLHQLVPRVKSMSCEKTKEGAIWVRSEVEWKAKKGAAQEGFLSGKIKLIPKPLPENAASFRVTMEYLISGEEGIGVKCEVKPSEGSISLPRVGIEFGLSADYRHLAYFGRGPHDNYVDRQSGAPFGEYAGEVIGMLTPYAKPQDCGSRNGVRWLELRSPKSGVRFESEFGMIGTVLPYQAMDLVRCSHHHLLPPSPGTYVTIDLKQLGLGQNSCGTPPMEKDKVRMEPHSFDFRIRSC